MIFFTYLIKRWDSKGKITYYTGYSNNPNRRYSEHKKKGSNSGFKLGPMIVICKSKSRKLAMSVESMVKRKPHQWKKEVYELGNV